MTTTARTMSFAGAGAMGLAALSIASPAAAATVAGCGDAPAGATLTRTGNVCQLDFATPGPASWTVPSGLTGLYAVIAAGGGGAEADGATVGYAGSGGEVLYVDYSSAAAGTPVSIVVGAGGVSDATSPSDGGDSSVTIGAATTANGGSSSRVNYCIITTPGFLGFGNGARTDSAPLGAECSVVTRGAGMIPSTDLDSNGAAPLAIFSDLSTEFGYSGVVRIVPASLDPATLAGTGRGADVLAVDGDTVQDSDSTGGSGRVIFRYAATDTLPATGIDTASTVGLVSGLGLAGVLLLVAARLRRRAISR